MALAPGIGSAPRTPGATREPSTAEHGYLRCGSNGAGHFVKMVHNGIEYGIMAAYRRRVQHHPATPTPAKCKREVDAETTPLRNPELYQFDINVAEVAEVWRRGSVDWIVAARSDGAARCAKIPNLSDFAGRVSDSGEGRWTLQAAIDEGIPAPVISAALFTRFASRGNEEYADKLMSAMRYEFGGHIEKSAKAGGR